MNRESLYLEIGSIDDDLILEAAAARGHKIHWISFTRLAGMTACLCLICAALLFALRGDVIYYNEASAPPVSKVTLPSDEKTTVRALTYEELFAHYGLAPLPDELSGLRRTEQPLYYIYQSPEGVIYDVAILGYRSEDGAQALSILLSTNGLEGDTQEVPLKKSRIDGLSLVLAVDDTHVGPACWAEFRIRNVSLRIAASGMEESSFTVFIRALIQAQK